MASGWCQPGRAQAIAAATSTTTDAHAAAATSSLQPPAGQPATPSLKPVSATQPPMTITANSVSFTSSSSPSVRGRVVQNAFGSPASSSFITMNGTTPISSIGRSRYQLTRGAEYSSGSVSCHATAKRRPRNTNKPTHNATHGHTRQASSFRCRSSRLMTPPPPVSPERENFDCSVRLGRRPRCSAT